MVPMIRQCAGTVGVAATGAADVTTVLGTGSAEAGNESGAHATVGALASAIFTLATVFFSLRDLNTWKLLMPGCKPCTVPVMVPGPLGEKADVTFWPFSVTTTRSIADFGAAETLSATLSPPVTKIGSGVFKLWIEYRLVADGASPQALVAATTKDSSETRRLDFTASPPLKG